MNYYPFHIGDFRSGTVNMTRQARWIYRDMLDVYYDAELPLSLDLEVLCDKIGAESDEERRIVERLLRFKFIKAEDGYHHEICEQVIADYHKKAETAQNNGKLGGRPRKNNPAKPSGFPSGSDPVPSGVANETQSQANQEPRTKNHKPEEPKAKAAPKARKPAKFPLPADFSISDAVSDWAEKHGHHNLQAHFDSFVRKARANGYMYVDWDQALQNAVVDDWAKLRAPQARAGPFDYQTPNEKAKAFADRLTGKTRRESTFDFIDINEPTP